MKTVVSFIVALAVSLIFFIVLDAVLFKVQGLYSKAESNVALYG